MKDHKDLRFDYLEANCLHGANISASSESVLLNLTNTAGYIKKIHQLEILQLGLEITQTKAKHYV